MNNILLHELLASVKLPLDELTRSHLVVMEIPPASLSGIEHTLLRLIVKIRELGAHVAMIVQPNLRKRTQQPFWAQRWNRIKHRPFDFRQQCSRMLGNAVPGCHRKLLIGCSFDVPDTQCNNAPTLGATPSTQSVSLEGVLRTLCRRFVCLHDSGGVQDIPSGAAARGMLDFNDVDDRSDILLEPQRTPDSAVLDRRLLNDSAVQSGDLSSQASKVLLKEPDEATASKGGGRRSSEAPVEKTVAYPTDSKEKEKQKRNEMKEKGQEVVVKKRKFHVEDHYDDRGEDLSSLDKQLDPSDPSFYVPADYDTDQALSDDDHNQQLLAEGMALFYPVDRSKVAPAQTGSAPHPGPDPRAPLPKDSKCKGCRSFRAR